MTYLDCSVKGCAYNNEDGCCCKGDIRVEGKEAKDAKSTCCGSFKERGSAGGCKNTLKEVSKETNVTNAMQNTLAFPASEPVLAGRPSVQALSVIAGMKHSVKM